MPQGPTKYVKLQDIDINLKNECQKKPHSWFRITSIIYGIL